MTVESFVESRLKFRLCLRNRYLIAIFPSLQNVSASSSKLGTCSVLSRERLPRHFSAQANADYRRTINSKPLSLSPFTLDDYAGALNHSSRAPGEESVLLAEIHASLTNIIGTDTSRVLGSSSILATVFSAGAGGNGGAKEEEDESTVKKENGEEGTLGGEETPRGGSPAVGAEVDELAEDASQELTPEEIFFGRLIKRGIQYGKRWDRQAKLKSDQGRSGWERHLIGAICQRGGPYFIENFIEIMKHLFKGDPVLEEEGGVEEGGQEENGNGKTEGGDGDVSMNDSTSKNGTPEPPKSSQLTDLDELSSPVESGPHPEDQYLTLPLVDKLAIIHYLVTLVMGSKPVRTYLDDADRELTDLRKQRADVNKERRAL